MGNYKFRLSDMMPNAWFYKLRDMSKTRNSHPPTKQKSSSNNKALSQKSPYLSQPRQSYYYSSEFSVRGDEFLNSNTIQKGSGLHFPDPPRRSSKRRTRRKTVYKPSPRRIASFEPDDHCSCCHASVTSDWLKPEQATVRDLFDSSTDNSLELDYLKSPGPSSEFESDIIDAHDSLNGLASRSSSCSCGFSSSATDIIIDVNAKSYTRKIEKLAAFDTMPELDLPPILTKPTKFDDASEKAGKFRNSPKLEKRSSEGHHGSVSIEIVKEESEKTQKETINSPGTRKSVSHSSGIKLRANSPKLASKKIQGRGRKSLSSNKRSKSSQKKGFSESFAIVKASIDPQKDFRDSMMEMIVENNIRASKDLEDLLACYLSLNSDEYHELIIKAFEQIWFKMPDLGF